MGKHHKPKRPIKFFRAQGSSEGDKWVAFLIDRTGGSGPIDILASEVMLFWDKDPTVPSHRLKGNK